MLPGTVTDTTANRQLARSMNTRWLLLLTNHQIRAYDTAPRPPRAFRSVGNSDCTSPGRTTRTGSPTRPSRTGWLVELGTGVAGCASPGVAQSARLVGPSADRTGLLWAGFLLDQRTKPKRQAMSLGEEHGIG